MANAYKNVFITNISSIPSSGDTTTLGEFQLGVFNADTYQANSSPDYPAVKAIFIAQGTSNDVYPAGIAISNETRKTPVIKGNAIKSWVAHKAQLPQNMIVTLGWDGSPSSTKTLTPKVGQDVRIFVTLSGQPIADLLGASNKDHSAQLVVELNPVLPCADECEDNCSDVVDCNVFADAVLAEAKKKKILGGSNFTDYVKVTKLVDCDTASGLPTTNCNIYQVTIPDNGDAIALGAVQAQYPGFVVSRVERDGVYSTYQAIYCSGSPSAYVENAGATIPDCDTCPSGFTSIPATHVFTVKRTDAGTSTALDTFKTDFAGLIQLDTAIRLSYVTGYSTYQVYGNTSTTLALMNTRATTVAKGDQVFDEGLRQNICQGQSTITYAWTDTGNCTKAQKYYQITLAAPTCDADASDLLAALITEYASIGTVTQVGVTNTDTCTAKFSLQIDSVESCIECASQDFTFVAPWPYNGTTWTDVQGSPYGTSCVCGIKFESAYVSRKRKECYFDAVSYEVEPLFIAVSTRNPDLNDFSQLCDELLPVTTIQNIKYASGKGEHIADFFKRSRFDYNDPWKPDAAERDARGYSLGVDLEGYYDQFVLTFTSDYPAKGQQSGFGQSQESLHEFSFYFPAGAGQNFVNAINSFISFPTSAIDPVTL